MGITAIILISWEIALFEYILQVPANRIGFLKNGRHFNLWYLKVSTLVVLTIFSVILFKTKPLKLSYNWIWFLDYSSLFYFHKNDKKMKLVNLIHNFAK